VYRTSVRLLGLLTALFVLVGCTDVGGRAHAVAPTPTLVATESPSAGGYSSYGGAVTASGVAAPAKWVALGARTGGIVTEVAVKPGQEVPAGALLVSLDATGLQISLQQAQEGVALQQASLDQLLQGASDQVVVRADRDNAYEIAQAELALEISREQLDQARKNDPAENVVLARAKVRQLELQLEQVRAQDPAPAVTIAQVALERAEIALNSTQDEYTKALDRPWEDQSIRDAWSERLKQAQLDYKVAQAQLDNALNSQEAHELSLDVVSAQIEETKAQLMQAIHAQEAYSATLSVLDTESRAAQAKLDHLRAWENPYRDKASDAEIAQARARLEQAQLAVAQIEQQVTDAQIRAPSSGTVASVDVRVGEFVASGQALVVMADLNTLRAETTDLSERDVDQVKLDQQATVHVDGLNAEIHGRVVDISPEATTMGGDVVYQVIIELDELPPGLRWGMSMEVEIMTG
jgi:multidrug efflux pump subunit AcrA (membrane-fusion protein)